MVLPPVTQRIVEEWMVPANRRSASIDVMLLALYMQAARFLCWHRVKCDGEFPMLYAFHFAPSGAYKDQPIENLAEALAPLFQRMSRLKGENVERRRRKVEDVAKVLQGASAQKAYRAENRVPRFSNTMSKGTVNGLQKERAAAEAAGIGHVHYEHSEIVDFVRQKDTQFFNIMSLAKEAWNKGASRKFTISGEEGEAREHVVGVPLTLFVHGSIAGLLEDERAHRNLLALFEGGVAKRSLFAYRAEGGRTERTDEEVTEDLARAAFGQGMVLEAFTELYDGAEAKERKGMAGEVEGYDHRTMAMDPAARRTMNAYANECARNARGKANPLSRIEAADRHWKAFRLSCAVAALEHPSDFRVLEGDYAFARILTERWGGQFEALLSLGRMDGIEELRLWLLDHPRKGLTEIRSRLGLRYANEAKASLSLLSLAANEAGQVLSIEKGRGLARYYSLEPMPDHWEAITEGLKAGGKALGYGPLCERYGKGEVDRCLRLMGEEGF